MRELRPFFSFYGGKWRVAPHYPKPAHSFITEPFAGSAGFSLRYYQRSVLLNDLDPALFGIWDYLIRVKPDEVLRLPVDIEHIDLLNIAQEAKWLIGFWLNKGASTPCKTPSKWMRSGIPTPNNYWGEYIRNRIASQVDYIKHWRVSNVSYERLPSVEATWFIDPPYIKAGKGYKFKYIDYDLLSDWCKTRTGQVIVCEQEGADWLPFKTFRDIKANEGSRGGKISKEVVWYK